LRDKGVIVIDIDVTDDESVEKGVREAAREMGSIDLLINNAGLSASGPGGIYGL
jgi:NADP-dependent 3-hydroxy acid dehydrogenase YdfG